MLHKEIKIPAKVLEIPVEQNEFTLLRFFVAVFGKTLSREILDLLAGEPEHQDYDAANQRIYQRLKEVFPYFRNLEDDQIEMIVLEMYQKANQIVEELIAVSYPNMEYELGLLNTTSVPTVNLAKRIHLLMSNGKSTPRYKYEILRQDILALMLMELSKYNHTVVNSENLHDLQQIFETNLYEGQVGGIKPQNIFSVHEEDSNECLGTFESIESARDFIFQNGLAKVAHVKKHRWQVREVDGVGSVLANMRTKSEFSIIRKIIYNASLDEGDNVIIRIGRDADLLDTTGFMFVVPNGQRAIMLNRILMMIHHNYPEAEFVDKNKVKLGRGQSDKVSFLRTLVYLGDDESPIEIMVMDQNEYMNYRFELEQAHELFGVRKSTVSAEKLFPKAIYHYEENDVKERRDSDLQVIRSRLSKQSRVDY